MMKLKANSKKKLQTKTILVLVESLSGALKAGRFILKHLYDSNTKIILLQSFKIQDAGFFLMRNLSKILKDISLKDLTIIKNTLIKEFNVPSDDIEKLVMEGDMRRILKPKFSKKENLTVVIGEDGEPLKHKEAYKQISIILKSTSAQNVFYIEGDIALINRLKVSIISDNLNDIPQISKNFYFKISQKHNIDIEYIETNDNSALIKDEPASNVSPNRLVYNTVERVLKEHLINSDL